MVCTPGVPVPPLVVLGMMVEADADVDLWWGVCDTVKVEVLTVLNGL